MNNFNVICHWFGRCTFYNQNNSTNFDTVIVYKGNNWIKTSEKLKKYGLVTFTKYANIMVSKYI